MSIITDPDFLSNNSEFIVYPSSLTIKLCTSGNLSKDGTTVKCIYSKLKEVWKSSSTYIKYPFPMGPITDEQFEMVNGWDWYDNSSRYLLRTGGWAVKDDSGISTQEWAGIMTLGTLTGTDYVYFQQSGLAYPLESFQLSGVVNQAIQVYSSGSGYNYDYRDYLRLFVRTWQKTYEFSQLDDIGVDILTYQAYRFPLANTTDVKVTHSEAYVDGNTPYTGMSITWYPSGQPRSIGGVDYNFNVIIDANNGTAEEVYEFVQRQLETNSDIDTGASLKSGSVCRSLLNFVGDTLYTNYFYDSSNSTPSGGVFIDNYLSADVNRLVFIDDSGSSRTFPYTAILTLNFGSNLVSDSDSKYWVYFTDADETGSYYYGSGTALLVQDSNSVDITSDIGGSGSIALTFDYDTNNQGGRTPATDADITCVAIGLDTAQFVKATGTITRSVANSVSLVSPLERNYENE